MKKENNPDNFHLHFGIIVILLTILVCVLGHKYLPPYKEPSVKPSVK